MWKKLIKTVIAGTFAADQDAVNGVLLGDIIQLKREPDNKYDCNAILVLNRNKKKLGYIPKDIAKDLSGYVDSGGKIFQAQITNKMRYYNGIDICIEFKIEDNKHKKVIDKADNDGSSYKKAIVIDDVESEYVYIEKAYGPSNNWQLVNQMLEFMDDRPYDILTLELHTGEIKKLYFDISSFYGNEKT